MSNLGRLVRSRQIEERAQAVVKALAGEYPPVDILGIALKEKIVLGEDDYGSDFKGRIEFHPSVRRFLLFFPRAQNPVHARQVRFSIAHELGHFYLPEHRALLLSGRAHSSIPGFVCDNALEREADEFAAALILPDLLLSSAKLQKLVSLEGILSLSERAEASVLASAIRAVRFTEEAVVLVVSRDGQIAFSAASEEAAARGLRWVKAVPATSVTHALLRAGVVDEIRERKCESQEWFSEGYGSHGGWEQAVCLANGNLALTLLSFNDMED